MTKKRLLSAFLSLCMVFSMVPAAFAEGETENQASMEQLIILSDETGSDVDTDENQNDSEPPLDDNSVAKIDSEEALLQAIAAAESGATIKLSGNVEITKTIIIKDKTLTLDLSGYTITANQNIWKDPSDNSENNWSLISVRGSSNVTIKGNGKLQALKDDSYAVDVYDEDSTCTIKSGTFDGNISAIYVFQGKLIIEGGTFSIQQKETSGDDPYRFLLNCYDKYYKDKTASITVKGGTFKNFNPADCLAEGTGTNFCAAGHKSTHTTDDSWTVEQLPYVAAIGDKQYYTLAEAVAAAKDGDTIRLLSDASGSGIGTFYNPGAASGKNGVKNFTIDFGGHTYTCVGPAVGSSGTESQAFHLEWNGKDNPNVNVTLKGGTITSTEGSGVQMLVQNYCNLTLDHMVLDGTNVTAGYTLSNNCGNVVIKDSTILAPASGVAFDACDYSSYTGVTVTVEGDSYVQGKIEVVNDNGGDNNARLVLKSGYYTVDQVATAYSDSSAVKDLANYVAEGYSLIPSDTTGYLCMVMKKIVVEDVEIKPDVADPEVSEEELEDEDMTKPDKTELVTSAAKVEVTGIVSEAMDVAEEINEKDVQSAKDQLGNAITLNEDDTVTLYVQTYLDIKPKSYNSETKVLKLDVTPMVQVIASTAETADKIVTEEDATTTGKEQNAVVYRKAEPLQLDKQDVTVTIQLPGTFTTTDDTAYVVHTKDGGTQYLYDGEVKSAGSNPILTFTNPNGFSDFTVYGADPAVARVYASAGTEGQTGTGYMTLQQAIGAVKDNGYIVVKKDDSARFCQREPEHFLHGFGGKQCSGLYLCRPWLQDDEGGK